MTLQTLLVGGADGNFTPAEIDDWLEPMARLGPRAVQLYTLAAMPSGAPGSFKASSFPSSMPLSPLE